MKKHDVPVALLRIVEPIAKANSDLIENQPKDSFIYNFIEKSSNGEVYFRIYLTRENGGYTIAKKPSAVNNEKEGRQVGGVQDIDTLFRAWIKLVRELISIESVLDDPFIKRYSDFYFDEFEIVEDEDAFVFPFSPKEQERLKICLDNVLLYLEENDLPEDVVNDISEEISTLKAEMPLLTKAKVIRAISTVLARVYKESGVIANGIYSNVKEFVIKKGTKLIIELGSIAVRQITQGD